MKKTINVVISAVLLMCFFLLFPFQTEASEITTADASSISLNDQSKALVIMTDTYESLLPEGKVEGNFTAAISSRLTNSSLCDYYSMFQKIQENNCWGNALFYKTTLSLNGVDSLGTTYNYSSVTTTKPVELTLTIPEYLRRRPNRLFILLVRDSSGNIVELGRGTESITFETDFSYAWYDVAFADELSADRIDFTVEKPVPGDKVGDPKYRPQTNSALCSWDNNVEYTASYRVNNYRWYGTDPDTGNGYALGGDEAFEEGKSYSLHITLYGMKGTNPDVYINGRNPSWDIRSANGTWGEFSISNLDPIEKTQQETAEMVVSAANQHVCSDSDYEWDTIRNATETTDGEMRCQCKMCGNIRYSVPISAYYQFNANTVDKIKNAKQGATISIDTPVFISFHEMVKDELKIRTDVSLVVNYSYRGAKYQMLIPAGSAEQMAGLFGTSRFCGFRNMSGLFATDSK